MPFSPIQLIHYPNSPSTSSSFSRNPRAHPFCSFPLHFVALVDWVNGLASTPPRGPTLFCWPHFPFIWPRKKPVWHLTGLWMWTEGLGWWVREENWRKWMDRISKGRKEGNRSSFYGLSFADAPPPHFSKPNRSRFVWLENGDNYV